MQPQWGPGGQELPLRGRDVIVLLDVSASMLAEDVAPNRLAQAKAAARALALAVQRDGGHRLGLLTFAGRADVQCPLTRDYGLFLKRLDDATTDSVPRRGTSIGEAVRQAMHAFGELTPGYTDFVLISDGEDHRSLPLEAAADARHAPDQPEHRGRRRPQSQRADPHGRRRQRQRLPGAQRRGGAEPDAQRPAGRHGRGRGRRLRRRPGRAGPASTEWYAEHVAGKPKRDFPAATSRELAPQYGYFVLLAVVLLVLEMIMRSARGETA